jgi:hypothetical protein
MLMTLEDTKCTQDLRSTRELNDFLEKGWILIMTYLDDVGEIGAPSGRPHFLVACQEQSAPQYPDDHSVEEVRRSILSEPKSQ